jgi:hypothetical protein
VVAESRVKKCFAVLGQLLRARDSAYAYFSTPRPDKVDPLENLTVSSLRALMVHTAISRPTGGANLPDAYSASE